LAGGMAIFPKFKMAIADVLFRQTWWFSSRYQLCKVLFCISVPNFMRIAPTTA